MTQHLSFNFIHKKMAKDFEIDLVYLWVDGNDPKWIAKHNAITGNKDKDGNCKGRFADNDELKYSLRSVEKYAPWIHQIYIVTDDQIPSWLDTSNPKIKIIDHKEIIPEEGLPCFNSRIIEHYLYKIPGLADRFIYANDDMLINREVTPSTFFTEEGFPIVRFNKSLFPEFSFWFNEKILRRPLSTYKQAILNSLRMAREKFGYFRLRKGHHNIDAYLKEDYKETAEIFNKEISATLKNHLRNGDDIQRGIYSFVPLKKKRAKSETVDRKTSFMLRIHHHRLYEKLEKYNPIFFCVNDSQYANDDDRRIAREFLERKYPEKSKFEK